MIRAILFGLAISAVFFFTIFPWFLAAGGGLLMAAPFIAGSVLVAVVLGRLYRGALGTESADVRSRRRIAFGVTLALSALAVSGLSAFGVREALRKGEAERVEGLKAALAEVARDVEKLENNLEKARRDPDKAFGEHYASQINSELKRKRNDLRSYKGDLAIAQSATPNGWTAAVATVLFLMASLWLGWRASL